MGTVEAYFATPDIVSVYSGLSKTKRFPKTKTRPPGSKRAPLEVDQSYQQELKLLCKSK